MERACSRFIRRAAAAVPVAWMPLCAFAQDVLVASHEDDAATPTKRLGIVTITGDRATSLPSQIPTTVESITGAQIETRINATDSEDALKYLPSLLVRKRYAGDYNHAVLSSRASGTGNSARSMVFADGILLSNYLGNGAAFTPRWGLVTPEEIERVDVLYGPFSAAYPGNSVGAVVDYTTRMPRRFEAHAKVGAFVQPFSLYGTDATYRGWQGSLSLGDRAGAWSWWVDLNRLDSHSQPLTYATKLLSAGSAPTPANPGTPVTGAVAGKDKSNLDWWILGSGTQYHTVQDHAKVKLAYDVAPDLRVAWTLGAWRNDALGDVDSWLRGADGSIFYSGVANIGGRNYTVAPADFAATREGLEHLMHGLTVRRHSRGVFDWEVAASRYDYRRDRQRVPTVAKPAADGGGAGRITDLRGSGWDTVAVKGVWRPNEAHQVDIGVQLERYRWRQAIGNTGDWNGGDATTPVSAFRGDTRLQSVYAQDAWSFSPWWKTVLGVRVEHWTATGGAKSTGTAAPVLFQDRSEDHVSPKAAVGWQATDEWTVKLSTGRAVRMPTVGELFQGNAGSDPVTNPNLKPETSWTTELSAEWTAATHRLRMTLFHENTRDALYSQAIAGTTPIVNSTQNVNRIRTRGVEAAFEKSDAFVKGLDVQASVTFADSKILENASYVSVPGDTIGKRQPRVPRWRASLLASWRASERLTATAGARYGSTQFGTLNNSDPNGFAYQGFSKVLATDVRVVWRAAPRWTVSAGIDNVNNATYWNFHPYPQRTYSAELKFDL